MTWRSDIYDMLFARKDYEGEAGRIHELIQVRSPGAHTLLDVACGTGRHLESLRRWYQVEGLDSSPHMLAAARRRLPEVSLHRGDMLRFNLGREFDVITCLFSAIAHVRTVSRLCQAVANMVRHLALGGLLIVEPWDSPTQYKPDALPWVASVEEPGRTLLCMETSQLRPGPVWLQETNYLLGVPGRAEYIKERVTLGAFTHDEQIKAFQDAGLDVEYDPVGLIGRGLYIGIRMTARP